MMPCALSYLKRTPIEYVPIFSGTSHADLGHKAFTLSLACRSLKPITHFLTTLTDQRQVSVLRQEIHLSLKRKTCWFVTSALQRGCIIPRKRNVDKAFHSFVNDARPKPINWSRVQPTCLVLVKPLSYHSCKSGRAFRVGFGPNNEKNFGLILGLIRGLANKFS